MFIYVYAQTNTHIFSEIQRAKRTPQSLAYYHNLLLEIEFY